MTVPVAPQPPQPGDAVRQARAQVGQALLALFQPGELISARVLAQDPSGLYLLNVRGREVLAESATPLLPDQVVRLVVRGATDHLQVKLMAEGVPIPQLASTPAERQAAVGLPPGPLGALVLAAFEEAGAPLLPARLQVALQAVRESLAEPEPQPTSASRRPAPSSVAPGQLSKNQDVPLASLAPRQALPGTAAAPDQPTGWKPAGPGGDPPTAAQTPSSAREFPTTNLPRVPQPPPGTASDQTARQQPPHQAPATEVLATSPPRTHPPSPVAAPAQATGQTATPMATPRTIDLAPASPAPASQSILVTTTTQPAGKMPAALPPLRTSGFPTAVSVPVPPPETPAIQLTGQTLVLPEIARSQRGGLLPSPPAVHSAQQPLPPPSAAPIPPASIPARQALPSATALPDPPAGWQSAPPGPTIATAHARLAAAQLPVTPALVRLAATVEPQRLPDAGGAVERVRQAASLLSASLDAGVEPASPRLRAVLAAVEAIQIPDPSLEGAEAVLRVLRLAGVRPAAAPAGAGSTPASPTPTTPTVPPTGAETVPRPEPRLVQQLAALVQAVREEPPPPAEANAPHEPAGPIASSMLREQAGLAATSAVREHSAETVFKPRELVDYDRVLPLPLQSLGQPTPARLAVANRDGGNGQRATWVRVDAELTRLGPVSIRLSGIEGGPLAITLVAGTAAAQWLAEGLPALAEDLRTLGIEAGLRVSDDA